MLTCWNDDMMAYWNDDSASKNYIPALLLQKSKHAPSAKFWNKSADEDCRLWQPVTGYIIQECFHIWVFNFSLELLCRKFSSLLHILVCFFSSSYLFPEQRLLVHVTAEMRYKGHKRDGQMKRPPYHQFTIRKGLRRKKIRDYLGIFTNL